MGKFTPWSFLGEQWTRLSPALHADLSGKTVLVLGANTGIGLEAAKHFAQMKPARLILGCRSEERGRSAQEEIARKTGCAAELKLIDLGKFSTIRAFVAGLGDDPIDYVVANAGMTHSEYLTTDDGWEQQIQVNHLSTALVSFLLTPNMVKAAELHKSQSRLVVVCSEMHFYGNLERVLATPNLLQALSDKEYSTPADMAHRYFDTKLFNVMFTRAYAERIKTSTHIVASTVNPGYCKTTFGKSLPFGQKVLMRVMDVVVGRSAEHGSRQLIWAALGPDGKDGEHTRFLHGAYVTTLEVREPSDYVLSKEGHDTQDRVWHETIDILKTISPELENVVQTYF